MIGFLRKKQKAGLEYVKATRKIAFLHIDFNLAGYSRMLDEDCYLQFDKVYAISQEVRDTFENVYPECKSKTELFNNIINPYKYYGNI